MGTFLKTVIFCSYTCWC